MIPSYLKDSGDPQKWVRHFMQASPQTEAQILEWFEAFKSAVDASAYADGYNEGYENAKSE